jgi:3-deoxy-D-manno-octulosonic-acid transferase
MVWKAFYNIIVIPALAAGCYAAARFNPKIRQGIVGRRRVFETLTNQLQTARRLERTAWFHFTSVGEFEQAKPLIEAVKEDARIVLTYYSPSVQPNVEKYPHSDAAAYLPLDTARNARRLFQIINPAVLIFSKFDVWPNLVWRAAALNVPVILIAGTLHAKSRRIAPVARSFFRAVHRHIAAHCVISEADAQRFRLICPPDARIEAAGDTRFDRVYQRAVAVEANAQFFPGQATLRRPILVAGSAYVEEEQALCEAMDALRRAASPYLPHLILVPHEPTAERIHEIRKRLKEWKFSRLCFSELNESADLGALDVLVIDTVGLLARLYKLGDVAFVGGSFHGSVHNVMEPAAMAKPILFGPTIHNAYEAYTLRDRGAARQVKNGEELARALEALLSDANLRRRMGQIARRVIEENLGAAERTLALIRPYLFSLKETSQR